MNRKLTRLTAIAAWTLLGGMAATAQSGVLLPEYQQTGADLRRGNANSINSVGYITSSNNVNNEFGAGETSAITNGSVTWPNSHAASTTPPALQIGSQYSQNIVVNTYNFGGYSTQFLNLDVYINYTGAWSYSVGSSFYTLNYTEKLTAEDSNFPFNVSLLNGKSFSTTNIGKIDNIQISAENLAPLDPLVGVVALASHSKSSAYTESVSNVSANVYMANHTANYGVPTHYGSNYGTSGSGETTQAYLSNGWYATLLNNVGHTLKTHNNNGWAPQPAHEGMEPEGLHGSSAVHIHGSIVGYCSGGRQNEPNRRPDAAVSDGRRQDAGDNRNGSARTE